MPSSRRKISFSVPLRTIVRFLRPDAAHARRRNQVRCAHGRDHGGRFRRRAAFVLHAVFTYPEQERKELYARLGFGADRALPQAEEEKREEKPSGDGEIKK